MLALLTALWIRVPYLFKELGFRVSLASGTDYLTFPDDFFVLPRPVLEARPEPVA